MTEMDFTPTRRTKRLLRARPEAQKKVVEDLRLTVTGNRRVSNLLVHLYWKVDDREVHRVIREKLVELDDYLEAIRVYLGRDLE